MSSKELQPAATMRSLAVRSFTMNPANYEILDLPVPQVSDPNDVLVKVHAAAINPGDIPSAAGFLRILEPVALPYSLCVDFAGTVHTVGSSVTRFRPGDRVYGAYLHGGCASEFLLIKSTVRHVISKMPSGISFAEAASFPAVAITSMKAFSQADIEIEGGLKGKTVFVPAALSGTGSIGVQLAKSVYQAGKVIATVSTVKLGRVREYLGEGTIDKIVDYTKEDVVKTLGSGSVDFLYDTMHMGMPYLAVVRPRTGLMLSLFTVPSSKKMVYDFPGTPWLLRVVLDAVDAIYQWRSSRWGVRYEHVHVKTDTDDLDKLTKWVEEGKVRPVVGRMIKLNDMDMVKAAFLEIKSGRGSIGKSVIEID